LSSQDIDAMNRISFSCISFPVEFVRVNLTSIVDALINAMTLSIDGINVAQRVLLGGLVKYLKLSNNTRGMFGCLLIINLFSLKYVFDGYK